MDTDEIIKQRFEVLPKDIKEAIQNTDLAGKFNDISSKHNLHVDQNGSLQTETLLVMIGLEKTDDYVNNLQEHLNISKSEAFAIADDVNKEIFNSIRLALQEMQEEFTEDEEGMVEDEIQKPEIAPVEVKLAPNKPLTPTPSMITPTTPITVLSQRPSTEDLIPKPIETNAKPVEKMGDFVVDITPKPTPLYRENSITKASVLKGIEDPEIDMADHMLSAPTVNTAKVEEKTVQAKTPPVINKSYGTDPYRESI